MAIRLTKKFKTILFIVLGVLVVGGGGFLLWRINQEDTVAPTDSDAACPSGYTFFDNFSCVTEKYTTCCVDNAWVSVMNGCYKSGPCLDGQGWTKYVAPPPATTYTLTYTAGSNGTLTGNLSQTVNKGASGTAVTAVANTGYVFSKWNDDVTANPRTDSNVQASKSVTAEFVVEAATTYTLTYTAGANGSITGTLSQTVNSGASGTPVTAVANSGYRFSKWSDDSTSATRTDSNVQANLSFTATFVTTDTPIVPTYDCTHFVPTCSADSKSIVVNWTAVSNPAPFKYVVRVNEYPYTDWYVEGTDRWEPVDKADTSFTITNITEGVGYSLHVSAYLTDTEIYPSCRVPDSVMGTGAIIITCNSDGEDEIIISGGDGENIPQTGIFDTVMGRISVGATFILLGGLISQYSKLNYLYTSFSDRNQFRREVRRSTRKSRRVNKSRNKLESRFR